MTLFDIMAYFYTYLVQYGYMLSHRQKSKCLLKLELTYTIYDGRHV